MPDNEQTPDLQTTIVSTLETACEGEPSTDDYDKVRKGRVVTEVTKTGSLLNTAVDTSSINFNFADNDEDFNFNDIDLGSFANLSDLDIDLNDDNFNYDLSITGELTKNVTLDLNKYTVSGDGIFDNLMETATKHLTAQFEAGRIRGEDYASDYARIYEASLNAAVQLLTNIPKLKSEILQVKVQAMHAKAQAMLAKAQALAAYFDAKYAGKTSKAKLALALAQIESEKTKNKELELQISKLMEEVKQTAAQACLLEAQKELVQEQALETEAKIALQKRQAESFNEKYKTDILKQLLDAWGLAFSATSDAGEASTIPGIIGASFITSFFNRNMSGDIDPGFQYNADTGKSTIAYPNNTPAGFGPTTGSDDTGSDGTSTNQTTQLEPDNDDNNG